MQCNAIQIEVSDPREQSKYFISAASNAICLNNAKKHVNI